MDFPISAFFVGRETFLQKMHVAFIDRQMAVIAGCGGSGKTMVLQEYTRRFSQHYQSIIWLNAATNETFLADLIVALQAYSLPTEMDQGTAQLFQRLHNHISLHQHALLILDNFSSHFAVQDLSQQPPNIHTVIITQARQTPPELTTAALVLKRRDMSAWYRSGS